MESSSNKRFQDELFRLSDFHQEVLVVCPSCENKAIAQARPEEKSAKIFCSRCGFNKVCNTTSGAGVLILPAHAYFNAELWLQAPYKQNIVWAYNMEHLLYLEKYVASGLRENKDRKHFTLVEKLPKFLQSGKNREAILIVISKLKTKV